MSGKIVKVSGPLVVAEGLSDANIADVVRVGKERLIGEILTMTGDSASIQVYEETSGLDPARRLKPQAFLCPLNLGRDFWIIYSTASSALFARCASLQVPLSPAASIFPR